jgi:hypothetical protein
MGSTPRTIILPQSNSRRTFDYQNPVNNRGNIEITGSGLRRSKAPEAREEEKYQYLK